jgi:WD40 repeat protein
MSELPVPPSEDYEATMEDSGGGEVEWRDPVSVTFSGHGGRVVAIHCSPFHRDVFASAGSDQEIRIYSLLQPHAPTHVIHQEETMGGIAEIEWSPVRPMLLGKSGPNVIIDLDVTYI